MMQINEKIKIINIALEKGLDIWIQYQDYKGNVTDRILTPREWVSPGKLLAYCHLRNEERHFLVPNIQSIKPYSAEDQRQEVVLVNNFSGSNEIGENITTASMRPVPKILHNYQSQIEPPNPFEKVTTEGEWQRLIGYYRECLVHEYQQQFTLKKSQLFPIVLDELQVNDFMRGKISLRLSYSLLGNRDPLRKFLERPTRKLHQLCIAQPLISLEGENISPVFFTQITMEKTSEHEVLLKSEGYEFSFSVLQNMGANPEEVADFLSTYNEFLLSQHELDEIKKFTITQIESWLSRTLPIFRPQNITLATLPRYAIYDGPCLFWVDNMITQNLIDELEVLEKPDGWKYVPDLLKSVLNGSESYTLSPPPDFINDSRFYITNINTQQRKAVSNVDEHPITVVTGPPGTGKSQLVLNLISQAYLDGKTVLLASHNNKAVDVVMDRIQGEIQFQGAIRTGNKINRKHAVAQMEMALNQIHETEIDSKRIRYEEGKKELINIEEQLKEIKDLSAKKLSFEAEQKFLLEKLPNSLKQYSQNFQVEYNEFDKQKIKKIILESIQDVLFLQEKRNLLHTKFLQELSDISNHPLSLMPILEFEDKWGYFGKGLFHPENLPTLDKILGHAILCRSVLISLQTKKARDLLFQELEKKKKDLEESSRPLTEDEKLIALEIGVQNKKIVIEEWLSSIQSVQVLISKIIKNDLPFYLKILKWLKIYTPHKKCARILEKIFIESNLHLLNEEPLTQDMVKNEGVCKKALLIFYTSIIFQDIDALQIESRVAEKQLQTQTDELPKEYLSDFSKINLSNFDNTSLVNEINQIFENASSLLIIRQNLSRKNHGFLIENDSNIPFLNSWKLEINDDSTKLLSFSDNTSENELHARLNYWQNLINLWEINNMLAVVNDRLQSLPNQKDSLQKFMETNKQFFDLAGQLMRETWFHRGANADRETINGAKDYISAIRQLNELDYNSNPALFRSLKEMEKRSFTHAIRMFPVWAITNLTAKSNFPLLTELFDLVIIDEASQCDFPSAIPLLIRAKKIVIIGDPNQLRHVATLQTNIEKLLGNKYGIKLDTFSYSDHSLFDIAAKSINSKPGPILLNEHYRSDPRIINFSNKEFYAGQLQIKTDLTKLGYEKEFINKYGGLYWIDLKGQYTKPETGSAYNQIELDQVKILVPKLIEALKKQGFPTKKIGFVTPFRAQESRFRHWLEEKYPESGWIQSGTAHQFQGAECDFIIFSPVLSEGIQKGTLGWLEKTYNLLNVAITRARFCLIIIGDWTFCNNLPITSHYNHLSNYVNNELHSLFTSIEDIPLLDKKTSPQLGILDPSNPENNRTTLERFIASLREFIWWTDPYFDDNLIELIDNLFEGDNIPDIRDIRIITAERQTKFFQGKPPAIRPDSLISLQDYLSNKGIQFECRVLPGEEIPHDRFLYYPGGAINMPPFASAYGIHKHLSEYTQSNTTKDFFQDLWGKAKPI